MSDKSLREIDEKDPELPLAGLSEQDMCLDSCVGKVKPVILNLDLVLVLKSKISLGAYSNWLLSSGVSNLINIKRSSMEIYPTGTRVR